MIDFFANNLKKEKLGERVEPRIKATVRLFRNNRLFKGKNISGKSGLQINKLVLTNSLFFFFLGPGGDNLQNGGRQCQTCTD